MKRLLLLLFTLHCSLLFTFRCSLFTSAAQVGTWRAYMSYYEPQQIVKASDLLYVRASNGLYSYNLNDQSITTYDKVGTLNDTYITDIAWNPTTSQLIIIYQNSNIDLLDSRGKVTNISAIYSKSMTQDKTINSIYINGVYAYLATGFGVVKINMQRGEVAESYILNENVSAVGISGQNIYLRTAEGKVLTANLDKNLIDPHNWTTGSAPNGLFDKNTADWDNYIDTVRTLQPDGPKYNNFGFMRFKNNTLYTVGGGLSSVERPATIQLLNNGEWTFLQEDMTGVPGTDGSGWKFVNMFEVDVDPLDEKHIFGFGRTGLYEYYDGKLVKYYNKDNSQLQTATTSNKYVLVETGMFDNEGTLWIIQSQVTKNTIIEITKDGQWVLHPQNELMEDGKGLIRMIQLLQDRRGLFWFINSHWGKPSFYCYDPKADKVAYSIVEFANQDGTTYKDYNPHCIAEDRDGNIWIGTQVGPFLIESERVGGDIDYVTQVKVPRNDGTNYADYLLSNVNITCMAIDGGNRKWFGTKGAGVYLISADNMEQKLNFNTSNSPLLSDNIESIAINNATGEVFFGTDQGLCSYMSDATEASIEMSKDNVYAYPNPVVSGYNGLITIVGLSFDSDVKILTASGQLVAQGRSNGGTFTWDGRDRQGRRVASGIYMVAAATSKGEKGTVCKIAVIN